MSVTCVHILEFQEKCRRSVFASATGGRSKPKAHIHNKLIIIEYYSFFMSEDNASALFAGCARLICSTLFVHRAAEWLAIGGHLAVFICSLFIAIDAHGSPLDFGLIFPHRRLMHLCAGRTAISLIRIH
jgi:hypothetical protein